MALPDNCVEPLVAAETVLAVSLAVASLWGSLQAQRNRCFTLYRRSSLHVAQGFGGKGRQGVTTFIPGIAAVNVRCFGENPQLKVVLTQDFKKLGEKGEVVKVAPGFARNFLYPRRVVNLGTEKNLQAAAALKTSQPVAKTVAQLAHEAQQKAKRELAAVVLRLTTGSVKLRRFCSKAAEEGSLELRKPISADDIVTAVQQQLLVKLDARLLNISEPIAKTGSYPIPFTVPGFGDDLALNADQTAFRLLKSACPLLSFGTLQRLFRRRQVSVLDGTTTRRVSADEVLSANTCLCIPRATLELVQQQQVRKSEASQTLPPATWLQELVLFKSEDLLVINKPAGLAVQGGTGVQQSLDRLMNPALCFDSDEPPRLVHRLDREVTGCLLLARTKQAAKVVSSALKDSQNFANITKRYWALTTQLPPRSAGRIVNLVRPARTRGNFERMTLCEVGHPDALSAITEYRVMGTAANGLTWLELAPITGRKHQLRLHCAAALSSPIVGDFKYGYEATGGAPRVTAQQLHLHCRSVTLAPQLVAELALPIPSRRGKLLTVVAPLPSYLEKTWQKLQFNY
eukprot:jgi/Chlat1/5085/Chrsp33S05103